MMDLELTTQTQSSRRAFCVYFEYHIKKCVGLGDKCTRFTNSILKQLSASLHSDYNAKYILIGHEQHDVCMCELMYKFSYNLRLRLPCNIYIIYILSKKWQYMCIWSFNQKCMAVVIQNDCHMQRMIISVHTSQSSQTYWIINHNGTIGKPYFTVEPTWQNIREIWSMPCSNMVACIQYFIGKCIQIAAYVWTFRLRGSLQWA